jgi:redox-regulated HSP33 family molecular chaperone
MKLDYIRSVGLFTELDPYLSSEYLPLDQTYVGIAATDSMQELIDAQEPSDNIHLLYQSCWKYYIVLIKQIQDRFKFEDKIHEILALVEPRNARNLKPKSLRPFFVRYPVLREKCSLQKTDVERRSQAMTDVTKLHLGDAQVEDLSVELYWMKMFSLKTRSGEIKYP